MIAVDQHTVDVQTLKSLVVHALALDPLAAGHRLGLGTLDLAVFVGRELDVAIGRGLLPIHQVLVVQRPVVKLVAVKRHGHNEALRAAQRGAAAHGAAHLGICGAGVDVVVPVCKLVARVLLDVGLLRLCLPRHARGVEVAREALETLARLGRRDAPQLTQLDGELVVLKRLVVAAHGTLVDKDALGETV